MTPFNLTDLRDRDTLHQRWLNKGVKNPNGNRNSDISI